MSTAPQDGVIATRPATTPEAAPSEVALPSRKRSTAIQANMAAQVAKVVLIQVTPVSDMNCAVSLRPPSPLTNTIDPTLNPNQPNHSSPAPIIVSVRLCGLTDSLP